MREFFTGWRRQLGCVTLLSACWLMSLCLRRRLEYPDSWYDPGGLLFALAFPLTLLSAYLILWTPRTKAERDA
jgi:hypothetical protein